MTIVDGIILVAEIAIGVWVSGVILVPYLQTMATIPPDTWATSPVWLTCHWGSLILRHAQTLGAVLTLAVLPLRTLRPRPDLRRLVRQPGFTACVAASIAICVGGGLNYVTTRATFVSGFEARGYACVVLLPRASEPGMAIAACCFS
jgi:hypothetical protein